MYLFECSSCTILAANKGPKQWGWSSDKMCVWRVEQKDKWISGVTNSEVSNAIKTAGGRDVTKSIERRKKKTTVDQYS